MTPRPTSQTARDPRAPHWPRTCLVVAAQRDDSRLRTTLELARGQADLVGAELLTVLNAWQDDLGAEATEALRSASDVLIFEPRPGRAHALNTAASSTAREVIAFTEAGAQPGGAWLPELLRPFLADRELAGAGGPVEPVYEDGAPPRWLGQAIRHSGAEFLGPSHHLQEGSSSYSLPAGTTLGALPLGLNMAWRRSWILDHPLRADLDPNGAHWTRRGCDACLALEALTEGQRIAYAPRALVHAQLSAAALTPEEVAGRFGARGQDTARVLKALGRVPANRRELERAAHPQALWNAWRRLLPRNQRIHRRFERAFAEAACAEWNGTPADADTASTAASI